MAKTIKEIADELGVSKQIVYKRFRGKLYAECAPYAHTLRGVVYLDEQGERIIKQDLQGYSAKTTPDRSGPLRSDPEKNTQSDAIIEVLQSTIDTLHQQLEVKDRQIERQAATIENLSSALSAAQALHAGTIQQQLSDGTDRTVSSKAEKQAEVKKRHWFARWLGK